MSNENYPNLNPSSQGFNEKLIGAKDSVVNNASNAYNTVANHPVTQNITSGPAAQAVYDEKDRTANEFRNVIDSRVVPDQTAATGQSLTHYHSMFYNILSWQNPRVTVISYASIITFIFFTRYVPVLKYIFKGLYVILGITAGAEVLGKVVLDRGLASHMRPRKYYTINRSHLEAALDDVEQLVNFFVIEFQRIVFAENIYATIAAFTSALLGYFLVKIVPTWGLALVATSLVYLVPLIYIKNRVVIDQQLHNAGDIISQQTSQIRDIAAEQTNRATAIVSSTASEYSAKAQTMIGQGKARAASPSAPNPANVNPFKNEPERNITKDDFPSAPSSLKQAEKDFPEAPKTDITASDLSANSRDFSSNNINDFGSNGDDFATDSYASQPIIEHTPIPDTAVRAPENQDPEFARAADVDGVRAEAFAS